MRVLVRSRDCGSNTMELQRYNLLNTSVRSYIALVLLFIGFRVVDLFTSGTNVQWKQRSSRRSNANEENEYTEWKGLSYWYWGNDEHCKAPTRDATYTTLYNSVRSRLRPVSVVVKVTK